MFFPQDGGVGNLPTRWRQCRVFECFTHKMAAWEICLQDGGVSESFTNKMAAWEICPQNGGVSENFTHKMAAWEFCPQDGGDKQNVNKNNTEVMSTKTA